MTRTNTDRLRDAISDIIAHHTNLLVDNYDMADEILELTMPVPAVDYNAAWWRYYEVANRRYAEGLDFDQLCEVIDAATRRDE